MKTAIDLVAAIGLGWLLFLAWLCQGQFWSALVPRSIRASWRYSRSRRGLNRPVIPARIRRMVLAADRNRCVYCRAREQLQIDHIIPWSHGGLSVLWNLAVLCAYDNRVKSNYWQSKSGSHYRAWSGHGDIERARAILAAETRARHNPLRWLRASLGGL